jgi:hypothetical protein
MKFSTMRFKVPLSVVAVALLLGGCAAPANRDAMTPQASAIASTKQFPYSLRVKTGGGSETTSTDAMSSISDGDLKAAIEGAVSQSGMFKSVVSGADGDYELTVNIIKVDKPLAGVTITSHMEAGWTLIKVSDRSVIMRKSILSSGSADMSEAFVGPVRLRLSIERAAKDNITQGLRSIADQKL